MKIDEVRAGEWVRHTTQGQWGPISRLVKVVHLDGRNVTVLNQFGKEESNVDLDDLQQASVADRYLDLLAACLTRSLFVDEEFRDVTIDGWGRTLFEPFRRAFGKRGVRLVKRSEPDPWLRAMGRDWPKTAETMVGKARLANLRYCIESVLHDAIPGDLIETGVWRGGASIFMTGVLAAHGVTGRTVWVADSFKGLPRPDSAKYPADAEYNLTDYSELAVSVEKVRENFARYGLLDDHVRFLVGWFHETLPSAPISQLAVLRLDGDLYQSTMDALDALYSKVSVGGYVIVDDYGVVDACKEAVDDFRAAHDIKEPVVPIDWTGVYWRREH